MKYYIVAGIWAVAALLGGASVVQAQSKTRLTLQKAIERAQTDSPSSEVAQLRFERVRWQNKAFQSRYLPSLQLGGDFPGLSRRISEVQQDDGSFRYVPQSNTFSNMSLSVQQPVPFTGGEVFVSSQLSRVNQFGSRFGSQQGYAQWQSSPLVVGISQPLFQFNYMKWERRLQPLEFEIAERAYAEELENVAVEVTNQFFEVYIAQMEVENATFNVAVNDTIYRLSEGRYEIGKIAENDLLKSELALLNAQTALSDAEMSYEEAMRDLKIMLGIPYSAELEVIPPTSIPSLEIDAEVAVAQARKHRARFLELEHQALAAERQVAQARKANSFSANITARFGLNQTAPVLGDAYRDPLNQQRFSIGFQVPVFSWGQNKAEVEAVLAEQQRIAKTNTQQRRELEQEVYFEALQLKQLQKRVGIAGKADTVASRRFEVARNRYAIGNIDITDLFDAQREKDQANQAYIQTLRQFWLTYFQLRRLTLFDFARQEPVEHLDL